MPTGMYQRVKHVDVFALPLTDARRFRWKAQGKCLTPLGRFMQHVDVTDGCWEWTGGRNRSGYGKFKMHGRTFSAPRALWTLLHGDPGSNYILHRCDNPPCVRPDHLFLGNHQDNMDDMAQKGRRRGNIRLLPEQVREIRRLPLSDSELARRYGIAPSHVKRIRTREAWIDVA